MTFILNLDTSTKNCSISIAKSGISLISIEEHSDKYLHSEKLHTFIQYAIKIAKIDIKNLKSICINQGPGSYTSLRIGMSAAKGLCCSLGIPLLSLDSLTILCQQVNLKEGLLIPMIHAKSDLFYTSLYSHLKKRLSPIFIKKFNKDFLKSIVKGKKLHYIFGDIDSFITNKKNEKLFVMDNLRFIPHVYPSSMDMSLLSYKRYCNKKFSKIEKVTPFYY
ncbi:tRNA (adenosine(37)-N6)-threonylcarbamoyltransferase complex dimerization subunit type 1 TsaB [Blattabacterium cuenoti]|uniref:tRNA (adenosine(37)-N6)-threonylcarbamoyltransferase complex dimerization subunit type 1 TsaB n=1 Tax=Blattabacterium cuenoti TaxID=1653831 RepID=UPI00163BF6C2|nr:tRNA (adenosine(37)-N6)-threonylcarbamoyltransferase complex dimerization subunit type 1 TsaB [Blattabacterium cuenoti]